jgi:hypothetical protein
MNAGTIGATLLKVGAALPLLGVLGFVLMLERAFASPENGLAWLSGFWPATGNAEDLGLYLIYLLLMSGNGALLSWWLFLALASSGSSLGSADLRPAIVSAPVVAVVLGTVWALGLLAGRRPGEEALVWFLFLFAPTLPLSYLFLWDATRRLRRLWMSSLILGGFALLNFAFQLRYTPPNSDEPSELAVVLNSTLIAVAIGVWLCVRGCACQTVRALRDPIR